jgi:hypothetical protein
MNHEHRTTTDELFRNFVAAAAVLALVTLGAFLLMGWR